MSKNLTCNACQQQLSSGQYVNLETSFYHLDCFVCFNCKEQLGGKIYFEKNSQIYCEKDYHQQFGQKCYECNEIIKDQFLSVLDKNYHQNCFVCNFCKTPFKESNYYSINNQPFCKSCAEKNAQVCGGCQKPITDKVYSAIDKYWHMNCFRCAKCQDVFKTSEFLVVDQKPYHQECYQLNCCVCNKECKGEYYELEGQQHCHEECIEEYKQRVYKQRQEQQNKQSENKKQQVQEEPKVQVQEQKQEQVQIQEKVEAPKQEEQKQAVEEPQQKIEIKEIPIQKEEIVKPVEVKEQKQEIQQKQPVTQQKTTGKYQPQTKPTGQYGIQFTLKKTGVEQIVEGVTNLDLGEFKVYSYEILKNSVPEDVDIYKREMHLSDEEFLKLFKMTKAQFMQQPKWKQQKAKKELGLF